MPRTMLQRAIDEGWIADPHWQPSALAERFLEGESVAELAAATGRTVGEVEAALRVGLMWRGAR